MAQELIYTSCGYYLIPDIRLSYTSDKPLGKYGRMRRAYLEQNNPMLLDDLILTETLFPHLWKIDEIAHCRMERLTEELLERNPAPDKATQQLAWVQHILLALDDKFFKPDDLLGDETTTDGQLIYDAIQRRLKASNVGPDAKRDKLMSEFSIQIPFMA